MQILKNSRIDISKNFSNFFYSLGDANYSILHDVIKFSYYENNQCILKNLEELVINIEAEDTEIEGSIEESDFNTLKKTITEYLSYTPHGGSFYEEKDKKIVEERLKTFWNLVEKYFHMHPSKIYEHKPIYNSYFGIDCLWYFCFVLLNDQNEGILISAGASD